MGLAWWGRAASIVVSISTVSIVSTLPPNNAMMRKCTGCANPVAPLMIWAFGRSPSDIALARAVMDKLFAAAFTLQKVQPSRRHLVAAHWYWLIRSSQGSLQV